MTAPKQSGPARMFRSTWICMSRVLLASARVIPGVTGPKDPWTSSWRADGLDALCRTHITGIGYGFDSTWFGPTAMAESDRAAVEVLV